MDDPRYNVMIKVMVQDADGNAFFDSSSEWWGVRYLQVCAIEDVLAEAQRKLVDMSYVAAEQRGADPTEIGFAKRAARGT